MAIPTGSVMLAAEHLRTTLADVGDFRTWARVTDRSGALQRIHRVGLPAPQKPHEQYSLEELQALRPVAIVYTAPTDGFTFEQAATSAERFEFDESGNLVIELEQNVPPEIAHDLAEVDAQFLNSVGLIMRGLCDLFGGDGYLLGRTLSLAEGPYRAHPDDWPTVGDWQGATLNVAWSN